MKSFLKICLAVGLGWISSSPSRAENNKSAEIPTVQEVSLVLSDSAGKTVSVYPMSPNSDVPTDILFKATLARAQENHVSWTIEVTDPAKNLAYRLSVKGRLPRIIHWGGVFPGPPGAAPRVKPGSRYFMRLLLGYADGTQISSPWSFFATTLEEKPGPSPLTRDYLDLFIAPSGTLFYTVLKTPRFQSVQFPSLSGDIRAIWRETQSVGVRLEATTNVLTNYTVNGTGFFYSDLSFFYNYFLVGAALRRPSLPVHPAYAPGALKNFVMPAEVWGKDLNVEVGGRLFFSVLRGYGNQPIDSDLARGYQGLALTIHADRALGWFRTRGGLEAGYSILRGSLFQFSAEGALSYDRFEALAPAITLRYQLITGTPHPDDFDGNSGSSPVSVDNRFLMAGLTVYFKL